ncbi:MAG TPA: RagB/SusD family nutrient uptake outer membrane protein [Puia sp.]|nr:RagB/SusD family nutrient uptake outer membrane protein [Puia sp.]
MKRIFSIIIIAAFSSTACNKDFLNVPPQGAQTLNAYYNGKGVNDLLTGAYHDLTGISTNSGWWSTSGTYWVYGDITSGDAYTGGPNTLPDASAIEEFQTTSFTGYIEDQWTTDYDGISRSNNTLIAAENATDMSDDQKTEAMAEARFLRAHYHFNAKVMWKNVPWVDEEITRNATFATVSNTEDIWPNILADFEYAYQNLPEQQSQVGRVNKWAAACYIAKCYMFQQKYDSALAMLNTIMAQGKNSAGLSYGLSDCFHDNFDASTENGKEAVFQIQFSVDDNSYGYNSNLGETGAVPNLYYGPDPYYGYWKRPSFNLVNAFKTDVNGLPMMDASGNDTSNVTNMTNDMGIASGDAFTPYSGTVDPRLDWSLGRRGIPYLDWGVDPGQDWAGGSSGQAIGGPYLPMKNVYMASQDYGIGGNNFYAAGGAGSSVNYSIIRYAEVLLWAAECEVEIGSLDNARALVNQVRSRAKTGCQVMNGSDPAANYVVNTYDAPWTDKNFARNAVRFETRLELALEGHRFFDLVRWGIAGEYINAYLQKEQGRIDHLKGVSFTASKNEYFPIPQKELGLNHNLVQNPGY